MNKTRDLNRKLLGGFVLFMFLAIVLFSGSVGGHW